VLITYIKYRYIAEICIKNLIHEPNIIVLIFATTFSLNSSTLWTRLGRIRVCPDQDLLGLLKVIALSLNYEINKLIKPFVSGMWLWPYSWRKILKWQIFLNCFLFLFPNLRIGNRFLLLVIWLISDTSFFCWIACWYRYYKHCYGQCCGAGAGGAAKFSGAVWSFYTLVNPFCSKELYVCSGESCTGKLQWSFYIICSGESYMP
jgi:hypothetical protein